MIWGAVITGYCSDMTRTVFVDSISEDAKKVYDLLKTNNQIAQDEIKDGANIKIITRIVEGNLEINGYDIMHALGHGVGMNVHEGPVISQKNDKLLKENMVIAIEPGVYIPGKFGIRIEDTLQVSKSQGIPLTKSTKDYCIVG